MASDAVTVEEPAERDAAMAPQLPGGRSSRRGPLRVAEPAAVEAAGEPTNLFGPRALAVGAAAGTRARRRRVIGIDEVEPGYCFAVSESPGRVSNRTSLVACPPADWSARSRT